MPEREERDADLVAAEMMRRFGDEAAAKMTLWSRLNQQAGEFEAARFWAAVARAIPALQTHDQLHRSRGL